MKKLFFVLALLLSQQLFSNPVIPPPAISEFFFNDGNWQLEVFFDGQLHQYFYPFQSFDGLRLVSNSDSAYFEYGIPFQWDSLIVIDATNLTSVLDINPDEDFIRLEFLAGTQWGIVGEGIRYGYNGGFFGFNYSTPPGSNESIGYQKFLHLQGYYFHVQQKQSPPSIGEDVFQITSRGSFSGYVFDQHGNPVQDILFHYCPSEFCDGWTAPVYTCFQTDETGYFEADELFCTYHWFRLINGNTLFTMDTLFIEPDSNHYKEYILTDVGIPKVEPFDDIEVIVAPNPFNHKTTFHISIPQELDWNEARITIFNMKGQVVDFIPIVGNPWAGGKIILDWVPDNANTDIGPGLYLYTMELDGKLIKSEKLIINE
jgi:hypothetical protein